MWAHNLANLEDPSDSDFVRSILNPLAYLETLLLALELSLVERNFNKRVLSCELANFSFQTALEKIFWK
jgi:hypothetical protein